MKHKPVGFVGVGLMGHGMAKNLVEKGFDVAVLGHHNRAPVDDLVKRGAREAKSAAELAKRGGVVFLCVTGSPQVEALVYGDGGLLKNGRKGLVIVDCSTSLPASTDRIAKDCAVKGISFIDAPLTRTPVDAEAGRLNSMVGGSTEQFAAIQPYLAAFCEHIFHAGDIGAGHRLKLINNFFTLGIGAFTAEAFSSCVKFGVTPKSFVELISVGAVNSAYFQRLSGGFLQGNFDVMKFSLANAGKDVRYFNATADDAGLAVPLAAALNQSLKQALALGFGDAMVPAMILAKGKANGMDLAPKKPAAKKRK